MYRVTSKEKKTTKKEEENWFFLFSILKKSKQKYEKNCDFHPWMEDIEKKKEWGIFNFLIYEL
jgi:hypothetical protein